MHKRIDFSYPSWNSVLVSRDLPESLKDLEILSKNLWWCWNESAKNLFRRIDPVVWHECNHNPNAVLNSVKYRKFKELAQDSSFMEELGKVMNEFNSYMSLKSKRTEPSIAYFCMEYGLDSSLKIYSGGLGILAGDYLKESSDMNTNMVAVGFLYRSGYFTQKISAQGTQVAIYDAQDFNNIPASPVRDAEGKWMTISVDFPGRQVSARIWKVGVGRTDLYLLDTDFEDNIGEDRTITNALYGGDNENRLKQEILLGIGGIKALRALGINTTVYHCNEGHAAFIGVERLREYIEAGLSYDEALEIVRASSLFTTHTPVPAGHDSFPEDMIAKYFSQVPAQLGIDWATFMSLGKINPFNSEEKFNMSVLASSCSQEINGVSWLHGLVSQELLGSMWPGYLPEELHISSVTNGVHYPTWCAPEWKAIHAEVFGEEFKTHHYDLSCFNGIYRVSDEKVWQTRNFLRKKLLDRVKKILGDPSETNHYTPSEVVKIQKTLRDDVLTIGFARRFATYKRATLLFSDLDRLAKIVNDPMRPVQFLFAGKAHPADQAGQDLIKRIVDISKMPQFIGKIVFVPNYDISIAKSLVQGVDVWMNNPTRPQEASGTSGEKAAMNGVMHFSVLDGWWVEGYKEGAGWALPQERTYADQNLQNELDAATIYQIIESEIAPDFYDKNSYAGYSEKWIGYIKNTVAKVACNFTTNRMLSDYINKYYVPLAARAEKIAANDYAICKELAAWKSDLREKWSEIEVLDVVKPDSAHANILLGKEFEAKVTLRLGDVDPAHIGVEVIFASVDKKGKYHIAESHLFQAGEKKDGVVDYTCSIAAEKAGQYMVAARYFAYNPQMPHRQDFELVKWL